MKQLTLRGLDARLEQLPVTLTTADRFGRIAASLRGKGRALPSNDIWIAAQVMECGADLHSADNHYREVEGLAWVPFSPTEEDSVRERVRRYHADVVRSDPTARLRPDRHQPLGATVAGGDSREG